MLSTFGRLVGIDQKSSSVDLMNTMNVHNDVSVHVKTSVRHLAPFRDLRWRSMTSIPCAKLRLQTMLSTNPAGL